MPQDDSSHVIATASLNAARDFAVKPDADARAALARDLGLPGIRKLTFTGKILPQGARDLALKAQLGATVVQDCVVTGAPVTTRLDELVERRYVADLPEPTADEIEMPDDETVDPLPAELDLAEVMAEALALALPPWPRAEGVEPFDITVTEPGKTPLSAEDSKPFAALRNLDLGKKGNGAEND